MSLKCASVFIKKKTTSDPSVHHYVSVKLGLIGIHGGRKKENKSSLSTTFNCDGDKNQDAWRVMREGK